MITAAFLLVVILFAVYGILISFECGIALAMLSPSLSNNDNGSKYIYTPMWELTNLFLMFGLITFGVLFNNGLVQVNRFALIPLTFAGFGLLMRAILGMYIFYSHRKIGASTKLLLIIFSYLTPISLSVIAAQLFTGVDAWSSLTGILIIMASFIGITIIGISFVNRSKIKINNRTKNILYSLFALWAIIIGFMIPLSLNNFEEYLLRLPLTTIVFGFAISTAAYFLYSVPRKKENELYQFCIFLGLLIPIFLAIDLRPYVIYDKLTISSAYGTQTYQTPVIIGMIVCLPLLALGGYLLFKAILKKK